VIGCQYKDDAVKLLEALKVRLETYKLTLHPEKTRLIEFGRFAAENRKRRGEPMPETFDFLGFTPSCSITRKNRKFKLLRKTIRKRFTAKLKSLKVELPWRINEKIATVGRWLGSVVRGYFNYFAVLDNLDTMGRFRFLLARIWIRVIRRRSHKARMTWERLT
jgi:hypothetical protein